MESFGEISWEDDFGGKKNTQQNTKDAWLRLEEGSNVVRLVTKPHQYIVHKGVKKVGDKGFGQKVYCSNPTGEGSCPCCDLGSKASQRWFIGVIEEKSNQYKILDISYQVFSQIRKLARNPKWGDPIKYDIDIVVDKNGGPTGYYAVQPTPHTPLSQEAQKARDNADVEGLKRKVMPPTAEQVQKRLEKVLEGGEIELPKDKDGKKPSVQGKSASGKAAPKSTPIMEEDEGSIDDMFPPAKED